MLMHLEDEKGINQVMTRAGIPLMMMLLIMIMLILGSRRVTTFKFLLLLLRASPNKQY